MALRELQIYGLWAGKQTAKGTPLTVSTRRFKQVSGGFNVARTDGKENYSDATQFTQNADWVDTLIGNGAPGIQATPDELAWLLWAFNGGETTSAVTGPPAKTKHTSVPLPGLGHWLTFVTREGSSIVDRLQHNDCQINQVQLEGSQANKAVRITPTIFSLDPGEQRAADPAAVMPTDATFLYTDGTTRFTIDSTIFRGHSSFTITINKDLQPVYGDDVVVYDVAIGNAAITVSVGLYFDTDGRAQFNKLLYGTAAPAAGTKPLKTLAALGSYAFDLRARDAAGVANGDKFVGSLPFVKWAVPDAPDPNADGGAPEMTLTGEVRNATSGGGAFQFDIDTDAAAFTS